MKLIRMSVVAFLVLLLCLPACRKDAGQGARKLQVVTTLFPLYDFARIVGGERVEVRLLLPPGVEPHNFEPRPEDVARLSKADVFVYTNKYMEPWAAALLKGVQNPGLRVVDAGVGAEFISLAGGENPPQHPGTPEGHQHEGNVDPHIWLSIPNAEKMVDNIRDGLARRDPAGSDYYLQNAKNYRTLLDDLDVRFEAGLSGCRQHIFLHGGHYAFGYLAARYGLQYLSAYAVSPNAEPTPRKLMQLVDQVKKNSLNAIFYEELLSPRMAETIARETGAKLLKLHGVHNVSREDMAAGASYMSLMEENLKNLRIGLQCR